MSERRPTGRRAGKSTSATPANAEEQFRLLVESVKDYAILMLDPAGFVTTWNKGAEYIKGYRSGEIIGQHFSCFYPKEDVEEGKPQHELAVAASEGRFEDEAFRLRKVGTPFWANVTITPIYDKAGKLSGFGKVTRDMSARRKAEQKFKDLARSVSRCDRHRRSRGLHHPRQFANREVVRL
jgi:PAS domain S-box-containing protein